MIEFSGNISEENRKKINKSHDRFIGFVSLGCAVVCAIAAIVFWWEKEILIWRTIAALISFAVAIWQFINSTHKKSYNFKWDFNFKIDAEKIIYTSNGFPQQIIRPTLKVKKVIDAGAYYCLIFKFGDISNSRICQKDLIVKGNIGDFEKLFEGKTVRKIKN